MTVHADFSDLDALADDLVAAGPKAVRASSAAMTKIAAELRDNAQASAPVATGELKGSIVIKGGKDYRIVEATAPHAFFVEFGTSDTAPQPFMWPHVPAASRALAEEMGAISPFDGLI